MTRKNRNPYHTEWERKNVRKVLIKINLQTERAMAEWMENKPNMQGYIKSLIKADMENSEKNKAD